MEGFEIKDCPNYILTDEGKVWNKKYNRYVKEHKGNVQISNKDKITINISIRQLLIEHDLIKVPQIEGVKHVPVYGHKAYQIYSNGIAFSKKHMKFLKFSKNSFGHLSIELDGERYFIHRLVFSHFKHFIPEGFDIHHADFNKANNDISNLVCLSHKAHSQLHKGGKE